MEVFKKLLERDHLGDKALTRPQSSSYNYNFIQRAARGEVGVQGKMGRKKAGERDDW